MQKCVFRKCCGVSQKWWILELSNLIHWVQHPWKLTSRSFWSSRNKTKLLSKQKCDLWKCHWYLWNGECYSFQTLAIVFNTHENLLVGISGALVMNENHSLRKKMCFEKMLWGTSEMVNARTFNPFLLCSAPMNTYLCTLWSSRNKIKPLSRQKCDFRKCCGVSQKWWMVGLTNICHCVQPPENLLL